MQKIFVVFRNEQFIQNQEENPDINVWFGHLGNGHGVYCPWFWKDEGVVQMYARDINIVNTDESLEEGGKFDPIKNGFQAEEMDDLLRNPAKSPNWNTLSNRVYEVQKRMILMNAHPFVNGNEEQQQSYLNGEWKGAMNLYKTVLYSKSKLDTSKLLVLCANVFKKGIKNGVSGSEVAAELKKVLLGNLEN